MDPKVDRLSQARKKLREYQCKQLALRGDVSSSPSGSSIYDNENRHSSIDLQCFNQDEVHHSVDRTRTISHDSSRSPVNVSNSLCVDPEHVGHPESAEFFSDHFSLRESSSIKPQEQRSTTYCEDNVHGRLQEELIQCAREKEQLAAQFSELAEHYSEIHAAYSKLSECCKNGSSDGSAMQTQLVHLQTAMSVVVKEKTSLQHRLREANEAFQELSAKVQVLTNDLKDKSSKIVQMESEISSAKKEIEKLNMVVRRQTEELEGGRREAISWQTQVSRVQQDRNDAQGRLKSCMQNMEAAQAELEEARKQLRMKDIYLRQLGAYSPGNNFAEQDIRGLHEENQHLKSQLSKTEAEIEHWKKEANMAREHYEAYGTQLNHNMLQISSKLDETSKEKMLLQTKLQRLEDKMNAVVVQEKNSDRDCNTVEMKRLENELTQKTMKVLQIEKIVIELENKLTAKEKKLDEIRNLLTKTEVDLSLKTDELMLKNDALEHAMAINDEYIKHSEDSFSLSQQLQNEKATVSRAIAQNHELKEQLVELQDRLVVVTQESMDRESGRLSALHLVDQLNNELGRLKSLKGVTSADTSLQNGCSGNHLAENGELRNDHDESSWSTSISECDAHETLSHSEEARAKAEADLISARLNVDDLRAELRRVTQENEELRRIMEQNSEDENQNNIHVELVQAVERINALSIENTQLRGAIDLLKENGQSSNTLNSSDQKVNGNENSCSKCKFSKAPSMMEKPLAWTELEAKFTKVIQRNADLTEEKERLEHIVMQLETENDTIGDYVTIYQHQRKTIKKRTREREEAFAKLSFEKEQMQQKLNELQMVLRKVLIKRDLLQPSEMMGKKGAQAADANETKRFQSSNFSEEFLVSDTTVVDGNRNVEPGSVKTKIINETNLSESQSNSLEIERESDNDTGSGDVSQLNNSFDDVGIERIMSIISELQDMEKARSLPPSNPNLHCGECRGKLINL